MSIHNISFVSIGYWKLGGYKLDAHVAKTAKIVDRLYSNYYPGCRNRCQTVEQWL